MSGKELRVAFDLCHVLVSGVLSASETSANRLDQQSDESEQSPVRRRKRTQNVDNAENLPA
jgi:hypothetical protein